MYFVDHEKNFSVSSDHINMYGKNMYYFKSLYISISNHNKNKMFKRYSSKMFKPYRSKMFVLI